MNNKYLLKLWPASVVRVTFHAPHSHIGLAGLQMDRIYWVVLVYLGHFHPEAASSAHVTAPASSKHQVPAIRTHAGVGDVQVLGPDGAIVTLRADVERGSYRESNKACI